MSDFLSDQLEKSLGSTYTLERELGGGGMSRVFVALDTRLHRRVVVKVLSPELTAGISAERFEREIQVAASLQHPHIVPLLAAGEADGRPYYIMPFVDGASLRSRLDQTPRLEWRAAVRILRDVAEALLYAHSRGVVHRDIKPDNVLLTGQAAVVTDFGIAKALSLSHTDASHTALTSVGISLGTPAYMAPEQAVGDPTVDSRADLYSWGVLAYEALAGRHPFAGKTTAQQFIAAHLSERVTPLDDVARDVPSEVWKIVMRCLEKDPGRRPQSADDVVAALDAAGPTGRASRRQLALGVFAALATSLIVGIGLAAWQRRGDALDPALVLIYPLENRTRDPEFAQLGAEAADLVLESTAETQVARVAPAAVIARDSTIDLASRVRAAARAAGAGKAVWGAVYRDHDSLRFQVQVTDVRSWQTLSVVPPISTVATNPHRAIEQLRDRVPSTLGTLLNRQLVELDIKGSTPTYPAYQEYVAGVNAYSTGRAGDAADHLLRASALDSTFDRAAIWADVMLTIAQRRAARDSISAIANARRGRMTPVSLANLDWADALARGDVAGMLRAGRRMAELEPANALAQYVLAYSASESNRPSESIAACRRINPRSAMGEWPGYWTAWGASLHALGRHDEELRIALESRTYLPSGTTLGFRLELHALEALGNEARALALLDSIAALSTPHDLAPASLMLDAANEFRVHGNDAASRKALVKAAAMYGADPQVALSPPVLLALGTIAFADGRLADARHLFETLAARDGTNLDARGALGAIAAREGRRTDADAADKWLASLSRPSLTGANTLWRARIAAAAGQREKAVSLLRQTFDEGRHRRVAHADPYLNGLHDYAPFRALMAPEG
jgi:tRNA A-37 threonylcarbamoyl transferase component Bud32/tetratricopeptide (TPR) repeat protein/TolB-like protein